MSASCAGVRLQPVVGHGRQVQVQQEAVGEGGERFVLGQRVGRAHAHAQGALQLRVAAPEAPLVEHAQQRVEDGRRAQEHLVEEGDLGLGQHAGHVGLDLALAQPAQVHGTEQLRRLGEAAQQVFEVAAAQRRGHAPHHRALGGARRADEQQVLAGHCRQHHELGDVLALDQALRGLLDRLPHARGGTGHGVHVRPPRFAGACSACAGRM
jgi:hypothetical protein